MKSRNLVVHGLYLGLIAAAFLAGRVSTNEPTDGDEVVVSMPSSLLPSVEGADSPVDKEVAKEVSETAKPSLSADDCAKLIAEILSTESVDATAFSQTIEAWVDADPLSAIDFLARGESREEVLRWLLKIWSSKRPEEASQWLAENGEMSGIDLAVIGLIQGIEKEDSASALQWARTIQDPLVKAQVWTGTGFQQFRHDHEAAFVSLADSGLPPSAQEAIQESWSQTWKSATKRNAQNVSSVMAAATAAGVKFDTSSPESAVAQIAKGVRPKSGAFKDKFFGVSNLTRLEQASLLAHLYLQDDGLLGYTPGDD